MHRTADLSYHDSLSDIIGSYQTTLQKCDNLLKDRAKFGWQGDFIHNVIWNFAIASDVQELKDQLAFLNIKLLNVLKTLDLQMAHRLNINIFRIHRDLATRIDGARDDIIQQFQVLRGDILQILTGPTSVVPSNSPTHPGGFSIPTSLETELEQQIQGFPIENGQFPLVRGLDAVVYHINAANTIPADNRELKRERQWLAVAKGFWIIGKVKAGQEYVFLKGKKGFACTSYEHYRARANNSAKSPWQNLAEVILRHETLQALIVVLLIPDILLHALFDPVTISRGK